ALAQGDLVAAAEAAAEAMIPVYVLNLARSPERRAFMAQGLAQAGIAPEFVAAIDGRARRLPRHPRLSSAETALILSHRKAWRRLLASPADHAVVLEDDTHLGHGLSGLLGADWGRVRFDLVKLETVFDRVWLARRGIALSDRTLRRLGAEHLCSAGYLVSRAGALKLLAATRALAAPIDHTLFGRAAIFERRLVAYQLDPAIVVQDNLHPDPAARWGVATTLHETDRARLAAAAKRDKPRGLARLAREAGRLIDQARRAARLLPTMRRVRVSWR
ncbi:MAG TPA: glycosyltransferase family 25 protein, partial [Roseiarcus sp.]|nr:glycosyltransferase family 25 protein [Roseiarcus sp.]